jgi:hypothetical protein
MPAQLMRQRKKSSIVAYQWRSTGSSCLPPPFKLRYWDLCEHVSCAREMKSRSMYFIDLMDIFNKSRNSNRKPLSKVCLALAANQSIDTDVQVAHTIASNIRLNVSVCPYIIPSKPRCSGSCEPCIYNNLLACHGRVLCKRDVHISTVVEICLKLV